MNEAIGLTAAQFGLGSGIFFLGYCLLEVPSNLALSRRARRWISRIMISWGLVSAAMSLATGPRRAASCAARRGGGGFFPGVAFYLATWFPAEHRTRIIAWFMVAIRFRRSSADPCRVCCCAWTASPDWPDGSGCSSSKVFPSSSSVWVCCGLLADSPENTALSDEEKAIVRRRLESERRPKEVERLRLAVRDPRVLVLAGIQFGFSPARIGFLRDGRLTDVQIGFVTSACYAVASIGMIVWAGVVDRGASKVVNLALACAVAAAGFMGAIVFREQFWTSVMWMAVAVTGINGRAPFSGRFRRDS